MINLKISAGESGFFNPFALAVAATAICLALAIKATAALTPAAATPETWAAETHGPYGYFPAHLLDRAREFELMPDMVE